MAMHVIPVQKHQIDEESVSVVLILTMIQGQMAFAGALGNFRWSGKYYKGEVLRVSGESYDFTK